MHIKSFRKGFSLGFTTISSEKREALDFGIEFGILKLKSGKTLFERTMKESVYLHMQGNLKVSVDGRIYENTRNSLFDEEPFAIHTASGKELEISSEDEVEIAVYRLNNQKTFPTKASLSHSIGKEFLLEKELRERSSRLFRSVFDESDAHPNAKLVVGEALNMPGRWSYFPNSSYPSLKIYHYRFHDIGGSGYVEFNENVSKVYSCDTLRVVNQKNQAFCASPGHIMYYNWAMLRLEDPFALDSKSFLQDSMRVSEKDASKEEHKEEVLV